MFVLIEYNFLLKRLRQVNCSTRQQKEAFLPNKDKGTILVVDDTEGILKSLKIYLENWGYTPLLSTSGREALKVLRTNEVDLVLSDQAMTGMSGIELLHEVKAHDKDIPFIILTAYGSIDMAVSSVKQGADDYLQKPYNPEELQAAIRRSLEYSRLSREHKELKNYLGSLYSFQTIITKSPSMLKALKLAEKVAKTPSTTVAIYGESGSGKEVLARAIHSASGRMESRFVAVNCAGIPPNLLESELFGHVKGAFTGADSNRDGKFDRAQKGTLLLDEIGDMPLDLQAKLLRVIQERVYNKIGSNQDIVADLRIITTTHRDLASLVKDGGFRKDLFHRINSYPITLPPLRDRSEDIPALTSYFLEQFRKDLGKQIPGISEAAMKILVDYRWPGNVRELRNCLERAAILIDGELIRPDHLNIGISRADRAIIPDLGDDKIRLEIALDKDDFSLEAAIRQISSEILERCGNNKSQAAEMLKVDRKHFYRRK